MAFADNWNDVKTHRSMGNLQLFAFLPSLHQYGEEGKKGWLFEEVLVTFSCLNMGRSPLGSIRKVREGTPCPSITYLAHLKHLFHHLL